MIQRLSPTARRLMLFGFSGALLTATHWPKLVVDAPGGLRLDLIIHFGAFVVLTVLVAASEFFDRPWSSPRNSVPSAIAALAFAGFDEMTQTISFFGRVADVTDYAADAVGVVVGLGLVHTWQRAAGVRADRDGPREGPGG